MSESVAPPKFSYQFFGYSLSRLACLMTFSKALTRVRMRECIWDFIDCMWYYRYCLKPVRNVSGWSTPFFRCAVVTLIETMPLVYSTFACPGNAYTKISGRSSSLSWNLIPGAFLTLFVSYNSIVRMRPRTFSISVWKLRPYITTTDSASGFMTKYFSSCLYGSSHGAKSSPLRQAFIAQRIGEPKKSRLKQAIRAAIGSAISSRCCLISSFYARVSSFYSSVMFFLTFFSLGS